MLHSNDRDLLHKACNCLRDVKVHTGIHHLYFTLCDDASAGPWKTVGTPSEVSVRVVDPIAPGKARKLHNDNVKPYLSNELPEPNVDRR